MNLELEFTALCLQTMRKEDYDSKEKRKIHNRAMTQLRKLTEKMKNMDAVPTLEVLLHHEDSRVRVNAAAACLELGVLREQTVDALRHVIVKERDATLKMTASMLLKQCMED